MANVFKDIGYLIRSPLGLAITAASAWWVSNLSKYKIDNDYILLILIGVYILLIVAYFSAFISSKIAVIPSHNYLPRELKYNAIYILSLSTTGFNQNSVVDAIIIIIIFSLWIDIGCIWIDMIFSLFFYDSVKRREFSLSFSIISWFITLLLTNKLNIIYGSIIGFLCMLLLPFIVTGLMGLTYRLYLLMGIQLYIIDHNNKWLLKSSLEITKDDDLENFISRFEINPISVEGKTVLKLESITNHLYNITKDLNIYSFDNNVDSFSGSIAEYRRWANELVEFIAQEIGPNERDQFVQLYNKNILYTPSNYKLLEFELKQIRGYIKNLIKDIIEGNVQIITSTQIPIEDMKDVFICHASEDKILYVEPLLNALAANSISYWYDNSEMKWGDNIVRKISEGFKCSKYVLVVLSVNSLIKNWPKNELEAALNMEFSNGHIKVLPLLCGTESDIKEILNNFPLLISKKYLEFNSGLDFIVNSLKDRLS